MLSALSLSVVSCSSDDDGGDTVTAYCVVDEDSAFPSSSPTPFPAATPGDGYQVVDDDLCDDPDSTSTTRSSHSSYFWYYGGVRTTSGRVTGGSKYMPSGTNITSAGGKTIRSGFGGSSSSHSGSGG